MVSSSTLNDATSAISALPHEAVCKQVAVTLTSTSMFSSIRWLISVGMPWQWLNFQTCKPGLLCLVQIPALSILWALVLSGCFFKSPGGQVCTPYSNQVWFFSVMTLGRVTWEWLRTHIRYLCSWRGRNWESSLHVSAPLGITYAHWLLLASLWERCETGESHQVIDRHVTTLVCYSLAGYLELDTHACILATIEEVLILE